MKRTYHRPMPKSNQGFAFVICQIGEDDNGKLEALGLVDGHQSDAVAALFENRRLGGLRFGSGAELVDESAERNPA